MVEEISLPTEEMVKATIIKERIADLKTKLAEEVGLIPSYAELPDADKIPHRIKQAEINALKQFYADLSLDEMNKRMKLCQQKEYYCGAEGIRKAKEWLIENKMA